MAWGACSPVNQLDIPPARGKVRNEKNVLCLPVLTGVLDGTGWARLRRFGSAKPASTRPNRPWSRKKKKKRNTTGQMSCNLSDDCGKKAEGAVLFGI